MFKTITRLLFGREEETPEEAKSGEVVEEGWLVVSHQETSSAENQDAELTDTQPLNSAPHGETVANMETDTSVLDPEPTVQSSSATSQAISGSFSQPKVRAEVTQLTCMQKAKAWADRHHMSRNAIQRQNRVRQGVQHHSFNLQQPGHRNLGH
ncbi:tumor protein p53-inducible nuclear protein 2 [Toxotes jaculatrix]|uniref:tumor protein p53-inducible nuclear protein 2 n=1 Tax=Toxotes jaculatrix TaxID=941984 RepID=UPI001B3A80C9|nr:tumor protein p53-inducible nuclear protein 2 [Toxotes jaculatrix]XP_040890352.1 tumor protein p53-inducible nuclear protein 2 [Toxotes jaculatrix]XP_040890353.1 tumor protein p53-inducible nuclear protein 2 [Toxotes jaculatrix]